MNEPSASSSAPPGISLRVPIETITKYAGATALVTAILFVAGILSTGAYLAAWRIPIPMVKLDPVTAALRAETVLVVAAVLGAAAFGLIALRRWIHGRGRLEVPVLSAAVVGLAAIAAAMVAARIPGTALAIAAGVLLFLGHIRGVADRWLATAFAIAAVLAAQVSGAAQGALVRDDPAWQTRLVVTTAAPIGGLPGGVDQGGSWRYDGLYLVLRDIDSLYVSRPDAGASAWAVPASNLLGLAIAQPAP